MKRILLIGILFGSLGCAETPPDVDTVTAGARLIAATGHLNSAIGFNYGFAAAEYTIAKRDNYTEEMLLACKHLERAHALAKESAETFDKAFIMQIPGMPEFQNYCTGPKEH